MGFLTRFVVRCLPLIPRFLVQRVARRYVAGEHLSDAVAIIRQLNDEGASATVAVLGESIGTKEQALSAREEYLRILDAIGRDRLRANISIKPTLLGLDIDEGLCLDTMDLVVREAASGSLFVRLDMEDRRYTDPTLRMYKEMQRRHGNTGVVLQAYLRRTLGDIEGLPASQANVRLCKGIYVEPRKVAWKSYETVRLAFLQALEKLCARGAYVGIATHDEHLICGALGILDRLRISPQQYEFQMLLGVEPELRRMLIEQGHTVRVYVPYGHDWYAYSTRRLRESPHIAANVIRAFFGRR